MRGDVLYATKGHIVFEGEEMVQIAHIHDAKTKEQAMKERNDFCDTLDFAIEKIERENDMDCSEHRKRHQKLHKALDELLADFLTHTGKLPSKTSTLELAAWSNKQTIKPTEKI